jgi:hypothetical protein
MADKTLRAGEGITEPTDSPTAAINEASETTVTPASALEAKDFRNDALAHVILLEAALIEFRGHFLRRDAAQMEIALSTFQGRVVAFFEAFEAALAKAEGR